MSLSKRPLRRTGQFPENLIGKQEGTQMERICINSIEEAASRPSVYPSTSDERKW
ncbi:MAG: hypothetical protein PVS3B3_09410 [Ktedonobacteraceae bacterium]